MADAEHLNADADGMDDEQESIEQDSAEQVDTNTEPSSEEPIAEALPAEAPTSEDTTAAPSSDLEIFEKYIEEDLDFDLPSRGDLREGTIVEIRPSELLVNVGS
ncbi:MAG: hypothetical protein ACK2UO_06435, partial [Caldilineaceae bacterium]